MSHKAWGEAACVIHTARHKERCLAVWLLSETRGLLKAYYRFRSLRYDPTSGVLQPFVRVWVWLEERRTVWHVTQVEARGPVVPVRGVGLFAGLYMHELLGAMLPYHVPVPAVFACYEHTVSQFSGTPGASWWVALRVFENTCLHALGYGVDWERDVQGRPIESSQRYVLDPLAGLQRCEGCESGPWVVSGATVLGLASQVLSEPAMLQESKRLLQHALAFHFPHLRFRSRRLWMSGHARRHVAQEQVTRAPDPPLAYGMD